MDLYHDVRYIIYYRFSTEILPTGNFVWLNERERNEFEILNICEESCKGQVFEVDIEYPSELHDEHNDYPLAPEKISITSDMLSEFQLRGDGKKCLR